MARLLNGVPPEFEEYENGLSPSQEEEAMRLLQKRATVVRQQVADSYAYYEVVKRSPLHIRWVPYMDGWEAHPAWIRGLNLSDVMDQEHLDKFLDTMW